MLAVPTMHLNWFPCESWDVPAMRHNPEMVWFCCHNTRRIPGSFRSTIASPKHSGSARSVTTPNFVSGPHPEAANAICSATTRKK